MVTFVPLDNTSLKLVCVDSARIVANVLVMVRIACKKKARQTVLLMDYVGVAMGMLGAQNVEYAKIVLNDEELILATRHLQSLQGLPLLQPRNVTIE